MQPGDFVRACAGKDKGKVFLVLALQEKDVLLVNGRRRKVQRPKRKAIKHVCLVQTANLPDPVTNKTVKNLLRSFYTKEHKEET